MKKENIWDGIILLILLIASGFFTWYLGDYFGVWYAQIFNIELPTFAVIIGFPMAYLLFIFFTIPIFIPKASPYVYAISLIPAFLFGLVLNLSMFEFFFLFLFAIVGYLLALFVNWIIHLIKKT